FVIVGTVTIYGLTAGPLARRLGLSMPNPQGVVFVGAHRWAVRLGEALKALGVDVLLLDTNREHIDAAEAAGLRAMQENVLNESLEDAVSLSGMGYMLALTPNDEVNTLAALHFTEVLGSNHIFQLPTERELQTDHPSTLRGRPAFGATFRQLAHRFGQGATLEAVMAQDGDALDDLAKRAGSRPLPLFIISQTGEVDIFTSEAQFPTLPVSGDRVVFLAGGVEPATKPPIDLRLVEP
ncbi:MAG: NAD-binding protein, partial [Bacteroidota bacterium]